MTSAASNAGNSRIPYQHSTALPAKKAHCHESTTTSHLPDVTRAAGTTAPSPFPSRPLSTASTSAHHHQRQNQRLAPIAALNSTPRRQQHPPSAAARPVSSLSILSPADKVESKTRPAVASKSKAHSRLASFGRQKLRGIVSSSDAPNVGETLPRVPVSPSEGSSQHKLSDASIRSNTSSETALTDDAKSDIKSFEERPAIVDTATWLDGENTYDPEDYERLLRRSPRMMHQTSSRLLRMTDDDRPFTRDFKDLFATLMVSLPLTPHRVRFSKIDHTFTTEEATTNLGSLKFSQSNRMPDPKDVQRIVTTTTTTTFSMAKEMARAICSRFLEARFIESVDGSKTDFHSKGSVWQLTPKGMHVLARFCQRNGIHQRHVNELLDSPKNMMQLVILERNPETDKIYPDQASIEVLFRRFAGDTGPNTKSHSSSSESDSMNDYATGLVGVKMTRSRREKDAPYLFSGKAAFDWLMDCCTTVDKREVFDLANFFLKFGFIEPVVDDHKSHSASQNGNREREHRFTASKNIMYAITRRGQQVAGWITSPNGTVNGDATASQRVPQGVVRDSNTNRMTVIIRDPALRLLFREYLRETHCEENLAFYLEVTAFLHEYDRAKRGSSVPRPDMIRETLASAYSLYNAFLAPGSPCELNIDHNLRNALAGRMTRAVGEDEQMILSLDEVAGLFDQAQNSVFKLMASDSVPKFSREPKYATILRERNLESMLATATAN